MQKPPADPLISASLSNWHTSAKKALISPKSEKKSGGKKNASASRRARLERLMGRKSKGRSEKEGNAQSDSESEASIPGQQPAVQISKQVANQISRLQDEGDLYTRKIEKERRKLEDLKLTYKNLKDTLDREREMQKAKPRNKRRRERSMEQKLRVLEDRLEKSLVRQNEAYAKNDEIKKEINAARKEKLILKRSISKLQREIDAKKEEMENIVNETSALFQEKQRVIRLLQEQQQEADREQETFEVQWRRLGKALESDNGLSQKLKQGADLDKTFLSEPVKSTEEIAEEEKKFKKAVARGEWQLAREKAKAQISQDRVQNFEDAFKRLEQMMGISDIDDLVDKFITEENRNYTLYTQISDMNNEISALELSIQHIEESISKYKDQGADNESQRIRILKDLEARLVKGTKAEEEEMAKLQATRKRLEQCATASVVYLGPWGSNSTMKDLVGDEGVTESNVLQYLGIIEQRTNEVLQVYASSHDSLLDQHEIGMSAKEALALRNETTRSMLCTGPETPAQQIRLKVEPPTFDDLSSDEEEIEMATRPLNRSELERYTRRSMNKNGDAEERSISTRRTGYLASK